MPNKRSLVQVWTPEDYHEVFERAATVQAIKAANAPVVDLITREVLA